MIKFSYALTVISLAAAPFAINVAYADEDLSTVQKASKEAGKVANRVQRNANATTEKINNDINQTKAAFNQGKAEEQAEHDEEKANAKAAEAAAAA